MFSGKGRRAERGQCNVKSAESGSLAEEAWLCTVVAVNQIAPLGKTTALELIHT